MVNRKVILGAHMVIHSVEYLTSPNNISILQIPTVNFRSFTASNKQKIDLLPLKRTTNFVVLFNPPKLYIKTTLRSINNHINIQIRLKKVYCSNRVKNGTFCQLSHFLYTSTTNALSMFKLC